MNLSQFIVKALIILLIISWIYSMLKRVCKLQKKAPKTFIKKNKSYFKNLLVGLTAGLSVLLLDVAINLITTYIQSINLNNILDVSFNVIFTIILAIAGIIYFITCHIE